MPIIEQDPGWSQALGTILGAAGSYLAGKQQGREAAQQRALKKAQVADITAQAQQRSRDAAIKAKQTGEGLTVPQGLGSPKGKSTKDQADALLAVANWYDSQGANTQAKEYRQQAAALLAAENSQARTATEEARPALIKAQTTNVQDLPSSRGLERSERERIAQENRDAAMQRSQLTTNAALQRASMAEAAAWDRMLNREGYEDRRDQRRQAAKSPTQGLSAQGQRFYEMLVTGNNPATPEQAQSALRQSNLPESDKLQLASMLGGKQKNVLAPMKTPKATKLTALDEVKAARSHGIKDDTLIVNQLIASGYTKAAAEAAVKAAP